MRKRSSTTRKVSLAALAVLAGVQAGGQAPAGPADDAAKSAQAPAVATAQANAGGTIHGTVASGTGKAAIPLPGVAVTATNTLTGKKYATSTDINGVFAMTIPRTGRYVVRAELAAFAPETKEVRITAEATDQVAEFGLELASRAAQEQAAAADRTGTAARQAIANALGGTQALTVSGGAGEEAATAGGGAGSGTAGASLPSLGALSDVSGGESVAVSGQQGTVNGLAGFNEDQIRERIQDAMQRAGQQGGATSDQMNAVVGMLGGLMGGGFGGGPGGGGPGGGGPGGGRGGRGGGGGGFGAFRNFNPAQPHGSIFYQGGNNALNSAPWSPTLEPETNPAAYSNRFGLSFAGSPYVPGLTKPNTKQFVFLNLTGQKNLNAFLPSPVRVPTALERTGDFSESFQKVDNALVPVTLYDPATGLPIAGNNLANASTPISAQALALLNFYPLCNINCDSTDPTVYNYQTISNAGSNNVAINTRYNRQFGQGAGTGFGGFGGGRGAGGGRNSNAPPVLRQNINASYNYSHSASDLRNIFLPLGGATFTNGNALTVGDTVSYGRLSNNASVTWNRSSSETRNYFTNTANDPTASAGLSVPNDSSGFAKPGFYNGLPSLAITNFASLTNTTPVETINQTISFTDFVAWRHKKHNMRFGVDVRRVHADGIGGNNPLGQYTFSGYATSSPADQTAGTGGQNSGSGFADFLLGLPSSTKIQAGLYKIYLRENVYDWYVQDDFRVLPNLTLNYGLRYEYFGPYSEKNNRLVNLDHNADFSSVDAVQPGQRGLYQGVFSSGLVNPDRTMFAPRFGFAYRPPNKGLTKDMTIRGGYGSNYNTGQFATFAKSLSFQPPFAATQTNTVPTPTTTNPAPSVTGCTTTTTTTTANMTLAHGFGCSTAEAIQNNYSVDKNYRLGMVQVYNLNLQKTVFTNTVLNLGYNGAKGSNLDVLGSPNSTPAGVTTPGVAPFTYETSVAGSHSNQLIASIQKRQQKGIALGLTYVYAHSIDNASSIGGTSATTVQNFRRLDLEEGNSSFDQRHNLSGNWLLELPFGPNRAFFNKGGVSSRLLDGFSLSGTVNIASGTYFTPQYSGSQTEASSGNDFTQRPDRVFTQPIHGAGTLREFFNTAAFAAPPSASYGTASRNSIEGPGTLTTSVALSRTVELGESRSFEARVTATNAFNTVQYSSINTTVNSANYGQVTSAAAMRSLLFQARYRF